MCKIPKIVNLEIRKIYNLENSKILLFKKYIDRHV